MPLSPDIRAQLIDLTKRKQYVEAEKLALAHCSPLDDDVNVLQVMGTIYRATNRRDAAALCNRRALELAPEDPVSHSNYGNLLVDFDRPDEALRLTEFAVQKDPKNVVFIRNHIATLRATKRFADAEVFCNKLLATDPHGDDTFSAAEIYLYQNKQDAGWRLYEERFYKQEFGHLRALTRPRWDGTQPTGGKRLLIITEQGFGDMMLMTRFFPELVKRFAEVMPYCKAPLHRLFSKLPVTLLDAEKPLPSSDTYDFWVSSMSLPIILEQDWQKWPTSPRFTPAPYCSVDLRHDVKRTKRLRVGIVWSGSITFGGNAKRSAGFDRFLRLAAALPEVDFISLQKGPREKDLLDLGFFPILPLGHKMVDFADTAALLTQIDCLVMTDSSLVHLAGSLDIPVLDLLNFVPYWMYFPEGLTTPLYKSVRFIRQHRPGDWDDVFVRTEAVLKAMMIEKREAVLSNVRALDIIDSVLDT